MGKDLTCQLLINRLSVNRFKKKPLTLSLDTYYPIRYHELNTIYPFAIENDPIIKMKKDNFLFDINSLWFFSFFGVLLALLSFR
jgi:hypothetical protein